MKVKKFAALFFAALLASSTALPAGAAQVESVQAAEVYDVLEDGNEAGSTDSGTSIPAEAVSVSSVEQLEDALADGTEQISLQSDLTLTSGITVKGASQIAINGNGHTIKMSGDVSYAATEEEPKRAMFTVSDGVSMTLQNVTVDGNSKSRLFVIEKGAGLVLEQGSVLTSGRASTSTSGALEVAAGSSVINEGTFTIGEGAELTNSRVGRYGTVYNTGEMTLEEGSVISNVKTTNGGGIYNEASGVLNINGGTISGADGSKAYGAAITNFGTVEMTGGVITGSNCQRSAVYNLGEFTMSGGSIEKNINTDVLVKNGSGGTVTNAKLITGDREFVGNFTMTGGSICDNRAVCGGGVMVLAGTVLMNGEAAEIKNNHALYAITSSTNIDDYGNGGGVFIRDGSFQLKDGVIADNTAEYTKDESNGLIWRGEVGCSGSGGGVYILYGSFEMDGGAITGNKARAEEPDIATKTGVGGGICVLGGPSAGSIKINGGTISENVASSSSASGIFVGNETQDDGRKGPAEFCISGGPQIKDTVYLTMETYMTVTGELTMDSDAPVPIAMDNQEVGVVIAKYGLADSGEFMKNTDAEYFDGGGIAFAADLESRAIKTGKVDLSKCTVSFEQEEYAYTGGEVRPVMTVTTENGGIVSGYQASYENNTELGTAKVTLTGDGYTTEGSIGPAEFTIVPANVEDLKITVTPETNYYTGQPVEPTVTVRNINGTQGDSKNYTLEWENNVAIGTASVTITGCGNYTGSVTKKFYIVEKKDETQTQGGTQKPEETQKPVVKKTQTISGTTTYDKAYGAKAFKLNVTVEDKAALTYESSNKKVVTVNKNGKVTVKGIGRAVITVRAAETDNYKAASKNISITVRPTKMAKPKASSVKAGTISVSWKKVSGMNGYQIQVARNKTFTKKVKYYPVKKTKKSAVLIGLAKNKTYYVRIQAYKKVDGKVLTGAYSKAVTVKVKKR